ncbi:MAG: FtsX-like permease family protein [Anaerolineaceae bacterium]|nr:FtsX-like permease family protein [Anaerolineaceae bacterium]
MIPLSTAQVRLSGSAARNELDAILASAISPNDVNAASSDIAQILRTRHRTEIGRDDFSILNQQDFLTVVSSVTSILTIFLGGIAAISLLVGGIGIMNIMLVSVIERTREIGLRKALGARKSDILGQFLAESVLLSLFGGLLGILLGWLISTLVGQIAANSGTPLNPMMGMDSILLATLFSTAVGLFFGLYPANRAASLEPVEALRTE